MILVYGAKMRGRRRLLPWFEFSYAWAMATANLASNEEAAVRRALADYYSAFSTLELNAILPYFNEPMLMMNPRGALSAPTHSVLSGIFAPVMEDLKVRGFGRSELTIREVRMLSAATALVLGFAIRFKRSGEELERLGITYAMQKADDRWKIAVIII